MKSTAIRAAILSFIIAMVMTGCKDGGSSGSSKPATEDSPFGIYSPYGEFQLDGGTFATPDDISGFLRDIDVAWVQELPFFNGFDALPNEMEIYSRVGREAGMSSSTISDPVVVENYKAALAQTIRNKKDRVTFWEVDTEPDGVGGWRNNPQGYAELLKVTYQVIKNECAECTVIFGGLTGGSAALDPQSVIFLNEVLNAGAGGYFDGLEFKRHHTSAKDYSLLKNKFDSIGGILSDHGMNIHEMPVFIETAMYDGDPNDPEPKPLESGLPIQTEGEQAAGLIKTYIYGLSLGIDKIFWNFVFERSDYEPGHATPFPQNPFNHYGLINNPTNNDGLSGKKLGYYTYKKMTEMLEGSDWNSMQTVRESGDVCIYKFVKNGRPIYVAWWDYFNDPTNSPGKTIQVSLSGLQGSSAFVTEAVAKFSTGAEVADYATAFNSSALAIANGSLTINLGETPVFVEVLQ